MRVPASLIVGFGSHPDHSTVTCSGGRLDESGQELQGEEEGTQVVDLWRVVSGLYPQRERDIHT